MSGVRLLAADGRQNAVMRIRLAADKGKEEEEDGRAVASSASADEDDLRVRLAAASGDKDEVGTRLLAADKEEKGVVERNVLETEVREASEVVAGASGVSQSEASSVREEHDCSQCGQVELEAKARASTRAEERLSRGTAY